MSTKKKLSECLNEYVNEAGDTEVNWARGTGNPLDSSILAVIRDLEDKLAAAQTTVELLKARNTVLLEQVREARVEELEALKGGLNDVGDYVWHDWDGCGATCGLMVENVGRAIDARIEALKAGGK